MEEEKGSFRGQVFGGFDRKDVINYIETAAAQFNALQEERDSLAERLSTLEEENSALLASVTNLRQEKEQELAALRQEQASALGELRAEYELKLTRADEEARRREEELSSNITGLEAQLAAEQEKTFSRRSQDLDSAAGLVDELLGRCAEIKADMAVNVTNSRRRFEMSMDGVAGLADELEVRLRAMRQKIEDQKNG